MRDASITDRPTFLHKLAFFRDAQASCASNSVDLHRPLKDNRTSENSDIDGDLDPDFRRSFLGEFRKTFGIRIPVALQESGMLIKKLDKQRKQKILEFLDPHPTCPR